MVESVISNLERQYLDKHLLCKFKEFLVANRFGAVLDGMNVALMGQLSFDHKRVRHMNRG